MRVFLDFEASSLEKRSYPIEVGWVFEDGREEAHLIRPAPEWSDWACDAQAIHGISRDVLRAQGTAHGVVARRMVDTLTGHELYASAPSWDGKWLSALLRASGLPRRALRLRDSEEAFREAAIGALRTVIGEDHLEDRAATLVEQVRKAAALRPVSHRALDDAKAELAVWREVEQAALALARQAAEG